MKKTVISLLLVIALIFTCGCSSQTKNNKEDASVSSGASSENTSENSTTADTKDKLPTVKPENDKDSSGVTVNLDGKSDNNDNSDKKNTDNNSKDKKNKKKKSENKNDGETTTESSDFEMPKIPIPN